MAKLTFPDMDVLFGKACCLQDIVPRPHPALVQVVETKLLPEKLDFEIMSLDGIDIREDIRSATTALKQRNWAECSMSAAAVRIQLMRMQMEQGKYLPRVSKYSQALALAELLLALCAAAEGDSVAAMRHADYAFLASTSRSARHAAVLFDQCLGNAAAGCLAPLSQSVRSATFEAAPKWSSSSTCSIFSRNVRRLCVVDADYLGKLVQSKQPFVVKDWQGEAWAARERWFLLAYFHAVAGHHIVPVSTFESRQGDMRKQATVLLSVSEFLENYMAPSCAQCANDQSSLDLGHVGCLNEHELLEQCPNLRADVPSSGKWRTVLGLPERTTVWLGTHDATTDLQRRSQDICITQVQGVRDVVVFPPAATHSLCAASQVRHTNVHNIFDAEGIKFLKSCPESFQESAQTVEMKAGDVLLVPCGWWYQARARGPACSVTNWF